MRRILYFIVVFIVIAAISGCVTAKKVVRERVDQKITGNRGKERAKRASRGIS